MMSVWCLYCELWTYFTPFYCVSIVDFEHVNAIWDVYGCSYIVSIADTEQVFTQAYYNNKIVGYASMSTLKYSCGTMFLVTSEKN